MSWRRTAQCMLIQYSPTNQSFNVIYLLASASKLLQLLQRTEKRDSKWLIEARELGYFVKFIVDFETIDWYLFA
jgi:hypothetical protein